MEQTLGKRIAENRKRLKLTQDGLAERLGITAQAVSKWENDQSCPDITMLPRLAEIFGITIDQLLGCAEEMPVHEAEVVETKSNNDSGVHLEWNDEEDDKKWEFHWDSGKQGAIVFALLVITVGLLTLASRYCGWDVGFWQILWPCAMVFYGVSGVVREFSVFWLGVTLFGGYYLVENLGFWSFHFSSELIFPIIVVALGVSLLLDALKKPKKPRFTVIRNGRKSKKSHSECRETDGRFYCEQSFGENTHYVTMDRLLGGEVDVSFGELTVDLSGCSAVSDNCNIEVDCSFGEVKLLVPRKFRVEPESSAAFASVTIHGHPDIETAGIIYLDADVSFGEVQVKYI